MKIKTLIFRAVLGFALCLPCAAQVGPRSFVLSTNRIVAATTNTTAGTSIDVGNTALVNVGVATYGTNAAAWGAGDALATFTLRFYGSPDDVTYYRDGTNLDVIITPGATNSASGFARFNTTTWKYIRPEQMLWPSTNVNVTVFPSATYWYK